MSDGSFANDAKAIDWSVVSTGLSVQGLVRSIKITDLLKCSLPCRLIF
jgi:hypothetical protein